MYISTRKAQNIYPAVEACYLGFKEYHDYSDFVAPLVQYMNRILLRTFYVTFIAAELNTTFVALLNSR